MLVRNRKLVPSSFPTSAGYESKRYSTSGGREWSFEKQVSPDDAQPSHRHPFLNWRTKVELGKRLEADMISTNGMERRTGARSSLSCLLSISGNLLVEKIGS